MLIQPKCIDSKETTTPYDVKTIKPTLAYLSKFPTLLYYMMTGITLLVINTTNWIRIFQHPYYHPFVGVRHA